MKGFFGTEEPLPKLVWLRAGKLSCAYEEGALRYLRADAEELVRRIYPAVRDEHWNTIPMTLEQEQLDIKPNSFTIHCTATFQDRHIRYGAEFLITGSDLGQISFTMKGEAHSGFLRNRIGLCVLHPVPECSGQPVEISSPDGAVQQGVFPETISPHQPFQDFVQFNWRSKNGAEAQLFFEGEIFEMEDQRNWTDHSFKIYGTPLRLPKPVEVKSGDTLQQKVTLRLKSVPLKAIPDPYASPTVLSESETTVPFPRIGLALSHQEPDAATLEKLREVAPEHLRLLVRMEQPDWEEALSKAILIARKLHTRLELVVVFGPHPWQEVVNLVGALTTQTSLIQSLSLVNEPRDVSEDGFLTVAEVLKKYLPMLPIGYATDGFFAELNRNRPFTNRYDFVAFSLNPQVHAVDFRTIMENVAAQQYPVQTIRTFEEQISGIHISPLTFRIRGLETSHDSRLHTEFGAAFTLLSLRYLAGVDQITYYETHGPDGLVPDSSMPDTPVYTWIKKIRDFAPDRIYLSQSPEPLAWDALVVGNGKGEKLYLLINFQAQPVTVQLESSDREVVLMPECITSLLVSSAGEE